MTKITYKKLERALDERLEVLLSPYGFELQDGGGCYKWENGVYYFIGCIVTTVGGERKIVPAGQVGLEATKKLYQQFMIENIDDAPNISVDVTVKYGNLKNDRKAFIPCETADDLDQALSMVEDFVMKDLYPLLKDLSDPLKMLDLYRQKDEKNSAGLELPVWNVISSPITALILSSLYSPSDYPIFKERYGYIFDGMSEEYKPRVRKLIEHLETNVEIQT